MEQVKEFARCRYADGGYPLVLVMTDGECLCADCVRSEYRQISNSTRHHLRDGWQAESVEIYWEGEPIICAHCGTEIESAYGSDENE